MNTPYIHIHIPVQARKEDQNTLEPVHIHIPYKRRTNNQTTEYPLHIYIHLETKTGFFEKWAEKFREFMEKEEQKRNEES